jgi:hypothetical protein
MKAMRLLRKNEAATYPLRPAPDVDGTERELASRHTDGLQIALLWHPGEDAVLVSVADQHTGHEFRFGVAAADALEAFEHPFVYAP